MVTENIRIWGVMYKYSFFCYFYRRLRREVSEKIGENGVIEDKRKKVLERGKGLLC